MREGEFEASLKLGAETKRNGDRESREAENRGRFGRNGGREKLGRGQNESEAGAVGNKKTGRGPVFLCVCVVGCNLIPYPILWVMGYRDLCLMRC